MPVINFKGQTFLVKQNENLLAGLLRNAVRTPFSCRSGFCHSCLLQVEHGKAPIGSQENLTSEEISGNLILACQSKVVADLTLSLPDRQKVVGVITKLEHLNSTSIKLVLNLRHTLTFEKLQRIKLLAPEGQEYTVEKQFFVIQGKKLELIIARKVGDSFTAWIHENATVGQTVMLQEIKA